jgi:uncharacterized membrane protein YdjX (TVP38/TMEM64 family)
VSPLRIATGIFTLVVIAAVVWLTTDRNFVAEWREEAGPIPFFIALSILPALGFPTTPFFILAGAMYGVWIGLLGSGIAIAANLVLCYWISHSKLRPWMVKRLARTRYRIPEFSEAGKRGTRFALLVRFAPGIPTFLKNYILGLAGVPFRTYFVLSFIFNGLYAATLIVLGESVFDRDFGTAGTIVVVLVLAGLAIYGGRLIMARRAVNENADASLLSS